MDHCDENGMARDRFLFICNPTAGGGRAENQSRAICDRLQRLGKVAGIRLAQAEGDSLAIASEAARSGEHDVIVAVGGDGTIRHIAEGLHGTSAVMAILPMGTANVLARELGQPRAGNAAKYVRFLVSAREAKLYPGVITHAGGRSLFLSMASVGPDSRAVANVSLKLKDVIGPGAYAVSGLTEFFSGDPATVSATTADGSFVGYWVIASRSRYYGGRFRPGFTVRAGEPSLQTAIFSGHGFFARVADAISLARGNMSQRASVTLLDDDSIEWSGGPGCVLQADGDIICELPVTVSVSNRPIAILAQE